MTVKLLSDILKNIEKINNLAAQISNDEIVAFRKNSIKKPNLECPIHGFYTCISWLYVTYSETGNTTIDFLTDHAVNRNLCDNSFFRKHKNLVNNFRTYLQHNLDFERKEDFVKSEYCIGWLRSSLEIETTAIWPTEDNHWKILTKSLLSDAAKQMSILFEAIEFLSKDESCEEIVQIWVSRIKRQIKPFEFDEIIEQVLFDFGQKNIDVVKIRKIHFERWNKRLKIRKFSADFKKEVRNLIEQTLLNDENIPLPINGNDIIKELKIQPGPIIKEIIQELTIKYRQEAMGREQLIEIAKNYYTTNC